MNFENFNNFEDKKDKASEDYWPGTIEKLDKERGEIPDPGEIKARAIINALGIPSGPYSALEAPITEESLRKDKIIAEYLTNKQGVFIGEEDIESDETIKILSFDFRDIYPNGLPNELKKVLDKKTLEYIEAEYKHLKNYKVEEKKPALLECPISYHRLPGGVDLFLRGYCHDYDCEWQKKHGSFLKKANKYTQIICIEGFITKPYGKSLNLRWNNRFRYGHYNVLMHEAVEGGFNGLFTEIDARHEVKNRKFDELVRKLPDEFFQKYFEYLKKQFPSLTEKIKSFKNLRKALSQLSVSMDSESVLQRRKEITFYEKKRYSAFPYLSKEGETFFEPTFFELGQCLFTDALATIKHHLIAKLMVDGHLEKGPIVDYQGFNHTSSKTFFLKYPQYAMEVVLRTIHHLFEGKIKEVPEIYKVFKNPNKKEIIREITKLVFKKPEGALEKSVEINPNQRELIDVPIDFLKIYNINPKKVIPSDKEIKKIRERLI